MMNERWFRWAEERGYRIAIGPVSLLDTAREQVERHRASGRLDPAFDRDNLRGFGYREAVGLAAPTALILVAVPRPAHLLRFEVDGRPGCAVIPPTYVEYRPIFDRVRDDARSTVAGGMFRVELLNAPLKPLAVLAGLAEYGRNNLAYVPGLGSYLQLVGLVTDMPLAMPDPPDIPDIESRLMARCADCNACRAACPTGAVGEDRLLLHAERCYTLRSEAPGELPPEPLPPSPECLIGCLRCQTACPANRGRLCQEETPFVLSETDTAFLLDDPPLDAPGWDGIRSRFRRLHLTEDVPVLARNFRRLVAMGGAAGRSGTSI
jgi:epoxyqueuosine reductase